MEGIAEIIDRELTLGINSLHSPATDAFWQFMSGRLPTFALFATVIVFLIMRLGWKKGLIVIASCLLCVAACDQFANLIKATVHRLRPVNDPQMLINGLHVLEEPGNLYGFFSAHAANVLGVAVCSIIGFSNDKSRSYRGYGIFIICWAVLVGISRIFVGKHFLGDVLAGFAVGLVFGWVLGVLAKLVIRKTEKPTAPAGSSPS
ncbi:MAG: phosphatase PAP2 family protein [Bacteroidales bacterium]|nr:phosphatase PAP2 family protein [Bacteroidales bacterium]